MPDSQLGAAAAPIRLALGGAGSWPQDMCHLEAMTVQGDTVCVEISYTGGCEDHRFELVARDWSVGRRRLEVELLLAHDARGDSCKAIVHERLEFSLQPIVEVCREELAKARGTVTLHIEGHSLACRLPS